MSATVKAFRTRAQLMMRAPRSFSRAITPAAGGSAVHYQGASVGITATTAHSTCEALWRGFQRFHMDSNGWADLAYTGGFCQHGYALAGRGFGVRTAANGTNAGNQNFYAFCWVGGGADIPTTAALNALEWWIKEARDHGSAGDRVAAHKAFYATSCPGGILTSRAHALDNAVISPGNTTPTSTAVPRYVAHDVNNVQSAVGVAVDGHWGTGTDRNALQVRLASRQSSFNVVLLQSILKVATDGSWGPASKAAMEKKTHQMQTVLKVASDGAWGAGTDRAFCACRNQFYLKS